MKKFKFQKKLKKAIEGKLLGKKELMKKKQEKKI